MADRVSASITLGGTIAPATFERLLELIADHNLSLEWDGEPFERAQHVSGTPLSLYAHQVPGGEFRSLENFCVEHGIAFRRWCGGYPTLWDPERSVYRGYGAVSHYGATEEDLVYIVRETAEALGSHAAILANFDAADFDVPPLAIGPETSSPAPDRRPPAGVQ